MDKCQMTCGDFIDLIEAWEKGQQQKKRQNQDLNLKKAGNSSTQLESSDAYRTPTQSNMGK